MIRRSILVPLAITLAFAAAPARACAVYEPLNLRAALSADLVVTGRIGHYRTDRGGNEWFDVAVDEVLRGRAGRSVTVRFSARAFGPPNGLSRGRLLFALRREGDAYTVLYHICSSPFMLPVGSAQAVATRRLLRPVRR